MSLHHIHQHNHQSHHCCFHSLLLQKKNTHQCHVQKTYQRIHCRVFHILVKTDHHHRCCCCYCCCCFHSLLLQMNHQRSLCRLIHGKTDHNFLYLFRWIHQKTYQTSHYCLHFLDERSQ
ncbi:hypothetical protein ACB092_09G134200 [Castanea dentata]